MDSRGRLSPHSTTSGLVSRLLRALRFTFDILYFFYFYFRDAVAFHLFDRVAVAFVVERFAEVGDALQAGENESRESFETGIAGEKQGVLGLQGAGTHRAFHDQS